MNGTRLYSLLAYAGALPFVACSLLAHTDLPGLPALGSYERISAVYALVIVSFMAGTHWGNYLMMQSESPVNLLLTSNVITIVVWIVFLSTGIMTTLWVSAAAFLVLLWVDYKLFQSGLITQNYIVVRRNVTAIVVVSLIICITAL